MLDRVREKYYDDSDYVLFNMDCLKALKKLKDKSVDMIFCDPPYFLSNGGISCQNGKQVIVNKAKWDEGKSFDEVHKFNLKWIKAAKRVLKDDGTIWISGTFHNIYSVGVALKKNGFKILNNITWQKTNPPPNLGCRCFTHSTETILWAKKDLKKAKHHFDYNLMKEENNGKQMKDVWTGSLTRKTEKSFGKHPTQKPEYLLERIIMCSTKECDIVLDMFCGSGTTGVVAVRNKRKFIGIDIESNYLDITKERINNAKERF